MVLRLARMSVAVRPTLGYILAVALISCTLHAAAAMPQIESLSFNTTTAAVAQRVVCRIDISQPFENPYDPACVRLDAEIDGPAGRRRYPCFYHVPVNDDGYETAPGEWLLRHAFRMEGSYNVTFHLWCAAGESVSSPARIEVQGRQPGGFVQPDRFHNGMWVHDDGQRFFASGLNLAWLRGESRPLYAEFFDQCAASGIRMVRIWMIGFARQEIEWSETLWAPWNSGYGLGRYNQRVAALFDWLFDEAARRGVVIQLVLETHGEWSTMVDSNWKFNPYNAAHGGFLASPSAFFSDVEARRRTRARYRYCVARWGAEPALAAWELFNEVDQSDAIKLYGNESAVAAWHQALAHYIQRLDAVPRPVVSSATDPAYLLRLAAAAPVLDRLDAHFYRDDAVRAADDLLRRWQMSGTAAALICGEFGVAGENELVPQDLTSVQGLVRRMLWRGRLAGLPAWYWFWHKAEAAGVFTVNRALNDTFADWCLDAERPLVAEVIGGPALAPLTVTPALGWGTTLTNSHNVVYAGEPHITLPGQSSYLQGAWNGAKGRDLNLSAEFAEQGAFEIAVASVSTVGANELVIEVDGEAVWRKPVAAGTRLQVHVGQGRHTLRLLNAGSDWLRLGPLLILRCADALAEGVALGDGRRAVVYVADKRFLAGNEVAETLTGVSLRLARPLSLVVAIPEVRFVDPANGAVVGYGNVACDEFGFMQVTLPPFARDLVVVVE